MAHGLHAVVHAPPIPTLQDIGSTLREEYGKQYEDSPFLSAAAEIAAFKAQHGSALLSSSGQLVPEGHAEGMVIAAPPLLLALRGGRSPPPASPLAMGQPQVALGAGGDGGQVQASTGAEQEQHDGSWTPEQDMKPWRAQDDHDDHHARFEEEQGGIQGSSHLGPGRAALEDDSPWALQPIPALGVPSLDMHGVDEGEPGADHPRRHHDGSGRDAWSPEDEFALRRRLEDREFHRHHAAGGRHRHPPAQANSQARHPSGDFDPAEYFGR